MLYLHLFNLAAPSQDTMDFSLQAGLSKDIQRSVSSRQSSDRSSSLETWGVFRLWVVSQAGLPHPSSLPSSALAPVPPLSASWGKRKGFPAVTRMSKSPSGLMHWPASGHGAVVMFILYRPRN